MPRSHVPPTHGIRVTAEDLGQARSDNIYIWQDLDVDEVPDSVINDQQNVVLIRQCSKAGDIRGAQKWV